LLERGAGTRINIGIERSLFPPILGLIAVSTIGGCGQGVLDPGGPIASAQKIILFGSLGIMLAFVIATILSTPVVAWWYRASHSLARYLSEPAMTVLLLMNLRTQH
jgi:heme/copper-type cytochrome/quinol oxidase subunit 2